MAFACTHGKELIIIMWGVIVVVCVAAASCPLKCKAALEPFPQADFKTSLCECVLTATKKYINTKETITVTSSTTDYLNNVTSVIPSNQMLLSLLTNEMKWTVLTENMKNHTKSTYHYYLEKISKSYIIFIRNTGEISINLSKLKTLNSWNPHSHFFVVSASIFQDPLEIASEILQALWHEQLLDGVVLLADPRNITVFNVYISKPYSRYNCGKSMGRVRVKDSCRMGVYRKNLSLFEDKIPKRLNNCTLVAGYVNAEPFVMNTKNYSVDTREYYHTDHGIEINLLNLIANVLGLKVLYIEAKNGEIFLNGTATGNFLWLKENVVDISVGFYIKTFERSYYFDTTVVYLQDRFIWCVPHVPILINSHNFLKILDYTLWILLIFTYVITVTVFWFVSRVQGNKKEMSPYRNYQSVAQYVFSMFLGLPVRFQPTTLRVRVLFISTVSFSIYLVAAYQTFLTSVLTGSRYGEKYDTPKDIYLYNLTTYFPPNSNRYFEDKKFQFVVEKMVECDNFKMCMDFVAFRRDSSFCVPKMYADYIYNSYVTKTNDPLLHCFGNIVSLSVNMLMRKGFPLFSKINNLIGRITSAGFITKWKKDILRKRAGNFVANIEINDDDGRYLRLKNLMPVFIALLVGHSLAFLIFVVEMKYGRK